MAMTQLAERNKKTGGQHTLIGIMMLGCLVFSTGAFAWDYDFRGYLGYAAVETDEDFICNNRACQGVLEDSLFYGLSASIQGEHLGAQVIVSQDSEEDPDISLAQVTWRQPLLTTDLNLRVGKIIVPLGLYGSQRITPTTRPGLVFPQTFLLNAYYDLLTLSDEGIGLDLRGDTWGFKAAYYEPEEAFAERLVIIPGSDGPLDFLLGGLLGLDSLLGIGGTPDQQMIVVDKYTNEAAYAGLDYRSNNYQADLGWIRQEINGNDVDAYNAGIQTSIGNFQPSIEAFQLRLDGIESEIEGISINLLYSSMKWQAFGSGVSLDFGNSETQELVVGGVYFWDEEGHISTRLTWHRLDGDLPGVTRGLDKADAYGLALAYSWD